MHYSPPPLEAAVCPSSSRPAGKALNPRGASGFPAASPSSPARDSRTPVSRSARNNGQSFFWSVLPRLSDNSRGAGSEAPKDGVVVVTGERTRLETAVVREWMHHVFVCVPRSVSRRHRSVQQHELPGADPSSSVHLQRRPPCDRADRGGPQAPQGSSQGQITHELHTHLSSSLISR